MLSKFSVKKPYTVLVAVILVIILGVVSFLEMTPDLLPSIELPYAVVVTSYVGASPEEVELTVTKPMEQSLATLNNVANISSTSSENLSMVILEFGEETNMDAMGVDIREKLDLISGYWSDSVGSPIIMKLNPDMMPVMVAAVDKEDMDTLELSAYVEDEILPLLESTEGVASVSATGLIENQIQVVINQKKIDKINKKLKKSVKEKLEKAQKKLEEAKEEISEGKETLDEKNAELNQGMTQASQALSSARMELLKNEIKMIDSEAEFSKKEAELDSAEKELEAKEKEFEENEKTVTSQLEQAEEGLAQLNALLSYATGEDKELLESKITELEAGIENLEAAKTALEKAKPELLSAREQLDAGKTALEQAKEQFGSGKQQLNAGKSEIDKKEQELEKQKAEAQAQINAASGQLSSGEKELESQLDSFDETKKEAISAAKVDDKITSDMVSKILQAQNFSMPAGYVQEDNIDYLVRVGDKLKDVDELKSLVLFDLDIKGEDPVTLADVADVFWSDNSAETYAKVNGNAGVMLSFQKQTSYATKTVASNIDEKFDKLTAEKEGLHFTALMDQGIYIDLVIDSVLNNLIFGAILAILILLLFLRDIKPTFIIACSIPLSVVFAIVLMYFSGVTLNIISLSGLAVGVGMLVDNSIVVIENIYRLRNLGVSAVKAAVTGAKQVSGAIVASTLTTVSVFLPIVFVKGISRELFTDMALTIGYSLMASLIVALTLVPAMSAGLLRNTKEKEHKIFDVFLRGYEVLIQGALKLKPIVLIVSIVILIGSIMLALRNGTSFMADMDSTQITVTMQMPEGKTLEDTIAMSDEVTKRIQTIEDVDTVGAMLAQGGMMGMGASSSDSISMYAILNEDKTKTSQEIAKEINELCEDLECEVTASGSNMDMSALGGSGVAIEISGPELDTLKDTAVLVASELETVKGTQNVFNGMEDPTEEVRIRVDKEKAMLKGLTVAQIYGEIQGQIKEASAATQLSLEGSTYEILVTSDTAEKMSREDIENYTFLTTDAEGKEKKIKLKNVAEITQDYSLSTISRKAQQRYITVTAEVADGYNIGNISKDVEKVIDKIEPESGYTITYTGENETINEALYQMVRMLLLAVVFIYLIMVAQFQSLLSPFIVMFTIPLAFTGGFLGLIFTGKEVSVIAMLGFVMLSGIVVNNGIVLVDYINQLRQDGMEKREAIVEAGMTRMRPILMTALTTILGLSTMAVGVGMGAELMQPIAIVTIGGLLYATITTLFVIPVLYDLFNRKDIKVISEEELEIFEEI